MSLKPSILTNPGALLSQARLALASNPERAAELSRQLIAHQPDHAAAHRLLGLALRKLDRASEAEKAEAEAILISTRSPTHRAAAHAARTGDQRRAATLIQSLIATDPDDVVALVMLGILLSAGNEFELAETHLKRAVVLAPADPSARLAMAEHYQRSRQPALALQHLDLLHPDAGRTEAALTLRAAALGALGRLEEEVAILEDLIARGQNLVRYQLRLGHALRGLGRTDEAVAAYRAITAAVPNEGSAWWALANLKAVRFNDDEIATMRAAASQAGAPAGNLIQLNFALGKACEDRGEIEGAFHHYEEGNRLRRSIVDYNPDGIGRWVDRATVLYSRKFFADRDGAGDKRPDPIFVIGIQRSGSTLIEQILASHPQIEGTAELTEMPSLVRQMGERAAARHLTFDTYLPTLSADELAGLGDAYLAAASIHRREGKPFFTDKMPNNWMNVGLIRTILPNAHIVDVRRHPLACGFANWKQLYAKGLDHSNDLGTMGRYYAYYVRMMRHMDEVQPGKIHRVIYEDLVDDVEGEVRRLMDYLGLEFDPALLEFHSTERKVRTISATQVRRPINRDGLDLWKAFERWLDPLKDALGDTLDNWRQ